MLGGMPSQRCNGDNKTQRWSTELIIYSQRPMGLFGGAMGGGGWERGGVAKRPLVFRANGTYFCWPSISIIVSAERWRTLSESQFFANILIAFEGLSVGKFHSAIAH